MAIDIGKPDCIKIDELPARISVKLVGVTPVQPRAILRNKKCTVSCFLDVHYEGAVVQARIPENCVHWGRGKFYVDFYEGCRLCYTQCVEFSAECAVEYCEVETESTTDNKLPWWKRKANG